eukprot:jgi/Tetstr1/429907/TSEL_019772.t1
MTPPGISSSSTNSATMAPANEIKLTETYHDLGFLKKLANQGHGSRVMPEHQAVGKNILKRLRGKDTSEVGYRQRIYAVGNGRSTAIGRLWPKQQRFVCYQNMLGSMRRSLAAGKYVEVDMANAHFKLLAGVYPEAAAINEYCDGRAEHLREVAEAADCPKWQAKTLFIIMAFGGSVDTWKAEFNVADDLELPAIVGKVKSAIDTCKALFETDDANLKYIRAAKSKNQATGKAWENTAFSLWLQDLEAKCMVEAIRYLQAADVHVASLIHDGALIAAEDQERVDIEALGEHVRNSTGLKCSFAMKPLELDEEDMAWKALVEEGYADPAAARESARSRRDATTNLIVDAGTEGGHRLLGKLFQEMFPKRFAYLGKVDGWFGFRSPRWVAMQGDTEELMHLMDNDLHSLISTTVNDLKSEELCIEKDVEAASKLLDRIAQLPFKNDLVKQLRVLYKVADPGKWLSSLDSNNNLLGFEDCVYDFNESCFREGRPEDMVSMSTGHKRGDMEMYMAGSDIGGEIFNSIESMHESGDVLWYVLKNLATSVVGNRPNDRFQIWSGTGANGKGLTKNLVGSAFGDYYYEPTAGLFASRSVSGSVLSSELAKLKGKRICIASEAEPGDKLRAGLLKQCTGHDLIQARDLYKSATEFRCLANIVLCFNEIPGVDDSSGGIERRLDLIRHPYKFVDNPTLAHEKLVGRTLQSKFSSKEYGAAFLGALIIIHNEHGFDFETPASVKQEAREYLGENDVLGQFVAKYYEESNEYSDHIKLTEMWEVLRSDQGMYTALEMRYPRQLSEKLKMKGFTVKPLGGSAHLRYFKRRALNVVVDNCDES